MFEQKVEAAARLAKGVLGSARHPRLPGDVSHTYGDKFALAEVAVKR